MHERFDKFTERARKVLTLAQEEATRFNHNYIGTEHLLLGLIREGDGVAAKVLSSLGVELSQVQSSVEYIIGRGDRPVVGEVGLTPRAKKVIELAVDEARRLGHHYIGTEHLLLGLVREGDGIAASVLETLGVNLEAVRTQTIQVLSTGVSSTQPASAEEPLATALERSARPSGPRPIDYLIVQVGYREGVPVILQVDDPRFTAGEVPFHQALRLLGAAGWNLSAIDRPPDAPNVAYFVFKRPA
jgi:ATP-dependent Clp protease ATP-binding subunit ClpA